MITEKRLKRILFVIGFSLFFLFFFGYFFIGKSRPAEKMVWGVDFSQKHAKYLGLDWKKVYLAVFDDLGARNLKISAYWDLIESEEGKYNFEDLDWQIKEAEKQRAKIILAIGLKVPRWPECHMPDWANGLSKKEQQTRISKLVEEIVLRYKDSPAINIWQIENEPFFPFGKCPWTDKEFLKEEIKLARSLDNHRHRVLISDSGEGSFWINAAKLGDMVGTTMYKRAWFSQFGFYIRYPLPPVFYGRKAAIIKKLFGKRVICVELQAEPWCPVLLYDCPTEEQQKTMNFEQFQKNIEFAKKTGFDEFYLWGVEWWYWMREKQNNSAIWDEAKNLFINNYAR